MEKGRGSETSPGGEECGVAWRESMVGGEARLSGLGWTALHMSNVTSD